MTNTGEKVPSILKLSQTFHSRKNNCSPCCLALAVPSYPCGRTYPFIQDYSVTDRVNEDRVHILFIVACPAFPANSSVSAIH